MLFSNVVSQVTQSSGDLVLAATNWAIFVLFVAVLAVGHWHPHTIQPAVCPLATVYVYSQMV